MSVKTLASLHKQLHHFVLELHSFLSLAITHECLARFYQSRNQPELEKKHIVQAIHYYDNYGAYAKTKILKSTYKEISC